MPIFRRFCFVLLFVSIISHVSCGNDWSEICKKAVTCMSATQHTDDIEKYTRDGTCWQKKDRRTCENECRTALEELQVIYPKNQGCGLIPAINIADHWSLRLADDPKATVFLNVQRTNVNIYLVRCVWMDMRWKDWRGSDGKKRTLPLLRSITPFEPPDVVTFSDKDGYFSHEIYNGVVSVVLKGRFTDGNTVSGFLTIYDTKPNKRKVEYKFTGKPSPPPTVISSNLKVFCRGCYKNDQCTN